MADIKHTIIINTTSDKVYEALTTQKGLTDWWGLITGDTAKSELGLGDVFEFNGASSRTELKITKLIPGKKVEWECIKGPQAWNGTKVAFDLEKKDNSIIVHFAHKNMQVKGDKLAMASNNWGRFMKSLKALIETGKGDPLGGQDYHTSIIVNISADEAFEKISNVSKWWTSSFKGNAENAGDTFSVQFGETKVNFKVTEVIPLKKIVWLVTDCYLHWLKNKTEWIDTKIVWDLSPEKKGTKIIFKHIGLTPKMECYKDCEAGWNQYINESLLKLITTGKGLIFEDSRAKK